MAVEKHDLIFGGISANAYGIYVESGQTVYNGPARAAEIVNVPGRNGALVIDKGYYENITIEYPCFTYADDQVEFRHILTEFKNAILSQKGYQKLVDTYAPDEYRYAVYIDGLEITPDTFSFVGDFTLKFNCKPQRYLTSGETEIEVSDGDVVNNPTLFDASPLLKIDGYGTVSFNGYDIEISQDTIDIPDVLWEAERKGFTNRNYTTDSSYPASFSITKTFDKSYFMNGDDVIFDASYDYNVNYDNVAPTITNSQNSATSSYTVSESGRQVRIITSIPNITIDVGTSSTWVNTTTIVDSGYDVTYTITLTVAYDGNSTITLTFARSSTLANFIGWSEWLTVEAGTGQSTYVPSSETMYLDCELGEAYSRNGGEIASLNGFVDLGSDLPKLASGNNTFALDNTITSLVLIPRWWKL